MTHLEAPSATSPAQTSAPFGLPAHALQPGLGPRPASAYHSGKGVSGVETLEQCVLRSLEQYFDNLDGAKPHALHEMVTQAVERPLLRFAMNRCAGNQSAAAQLLGMNRNTLRKKLSDHNLV